MNKKTQYALEELLPVFERLSRRYMGADTSSIPYEKAQSLMSAVMYCIDHCNEEQPWNDDNAQALSTIGEELSAKEAYAKGLEQVRKKARGAAAIFAQIMQGFNSYGSHAYEDTVVKGIPEFFKWYDPEFDPENHMLTFDYPIMKPMESLCGIDAVYSYLECIRCEQSFLNGFPAESVYGLLHRENRGYADLFENICRPVARSAVVCMLTGCPVAGLKPTAENFDFFCARVKSFDREKLQSIFEAALHTLVEKIFGGDKTLLLYLKPDMKEFAFEFISARDNDYLHRLVPCN